MIAAKPPIYPYPDLENSICVVRIDTLMVPNWKDIYSEMLIWNWDTVKMPKIDRIRRLPDVTADEISAKIRARVARQLDKMRQIDAGLH